MKDNNTTKDNNNVTKDNDNITKNNSSNATEGTIKKNWTHTKTPEKIKKCIVQPIH